jgi:signal transduction histidine kinase/ActR/RegA family two-component response regulator
MSNRVRPGLMLRPLVAVAVVVIAAIVGFIVCLVEKDDEEARDNALRAGSSVAEAVAQYMANSVKSADDILRLAISQYQIHQDEQEFLAWIQRSGIANAAPRVTVIGTDGKIRLQSIGEQARGIDVGDSPHFQFHSQDPSEELFIGVPSRLRTTGRWSLLVSRRINLPDGSFGGLMSAALDYDLIEKFVSSLDSRGGFISVIGLDGTVRVRAVNGRLMTDAVGMSIRDVPVLQRVKESRSGSFWAEGKVFEQGRRLLTYRQINDYPLVAISGQMEANIFAKARASLKTYYGFGVVAVLAILVAVGFGVLRTHQFKRAVDGLAEANTRFSAALQHMSHGLSMFDRDQQLLVCNDQYRALYRLPPELVEPGRTFREIINNRTQDDAEADRCVAELTSQLWEGHHCSSLLTLDDGRTIFRTYYSMHGGGWVSTHEDITERRNYEKRLEQSLAERAAMEKRLVQSEKLEAIGQLTGGIAHDFNNLLLVIMGNLELLKDVISPDAPEFELVESSLTAAVTGSELSTGLLTFSRQTAFKAESTDVGRIVADQMNLLRRAVHGNITLEHAAADEVLPANVDAAQLRSALTNLVLNARDAMPDGGEISVRAYATSLTEADLTVEDGLAPGDYVVLEVTDTGTGIAPEIVDKIFDPFFTTKDVGKGTGMGLSMVYGFVKHMRGHIKVTSVLGKGTRFDLFFPQSNQLPEVAAPRLADLAGTSATNGGQTILVVDDDQLVRKSVIAQLNSLGYCTIESSSPAEALDVIAGDTPLDFLFSDIVMPGPIDGLRLAGLARQHRPQLKVLLTSGNPDLKTAARSAGQTDVRWTMLKKPYRRADLNQALEDLRTHDREPVAA